ncbi:MAG: class I SAM-dependent methyltransferase [Rhodothermales bacterium]
MWDDRYSQAEFVYGTEPNDFLRDNARKIPGPDVISLAEGEGRNAVFLAGLGFNVTGVDSSRVGLDKAQRLAKVRSVKITTVQSDLADFDFGVEKFDGLVSVFCHLPTALNRSVFKMAIRSLRPGGIVVLEAYSPRQLDYGTGGPPNIELLHSVEEWKQILDGFEFELAHEVVRMIEEGEYHKGQSSVVQIIARKP